LARFSSSALNPFKATMLPPPHMHLAA
jgi:hypothetical protein